VWKLADVPSSGNSFALFLKSQRKWENPPLQDDHRDQFRQMCLEHKYDGAKHILPHGSYLVNLAQEDKAKAKQAYDAFLDDLRRCEALGITLYNFQLGSDHHHLNQSGRSLTIL
jgi:AP endonuclease-1